MSAMPEPPDADPDKLESIHADYLNGDINESELGHRIEYLLEHGDDPAQLHDGQILLREVDALLKSEGRDIPRERWRICVSRAEYDDIVSVLSASAWFTIRQLDSTEAEYSYIGVPVVITTFGKTPRVDYAPASDGGDA